MPLSVGGCPRRNKLNIRSKVTLKYPPDVLDNYLLDIVNIPTYWDLRDKCGAFADVNVEPTHIDKLKHKSNMALLVSSGLSSYSVLTHVGGAIYHNDLLWEIEESKTPIRVPLLNGCPIHFIIWEHSESAYNDLYSALCGIANLSLALIDPIKFIGNGSVSGGLQVSRCIRLIQNKYSDIAKIIKLCNDKLPFRHHSVHHFRSLIMDYGNGGYGFPCPFEKGSIKSTSGFYKKVTNMINDDIIYFEEEFENIYQMLLKNYSEIFLSHLSIKLKL